MSTRWADKNPHARLQSYFYSLMIHVMTHDKCHALLDFLYPFWPNRSWWADPCGHVELVELRRSLVSDPLGHLDVCVAGLDSCGHVAAVGGALEADVEILRQLADLNLVAFLVGS